MEIFEKLNVNKNLSLALGFFDGVHLGHQAVIRSAVDFAKNNGNKSTVITFQDHPCCYFYNIQPKYLIKRNDKIKLMENLGVDYLYFLKFSDYLASMDAQNYLKKVLIENFTPKSISTGFNHFFGAKKTGNVDFLKINQKNYGYKYFEISPISVNGEIISSTKIRSDLAQGKLGSVNSMLGYNYFLSENVVRGQQIGRTIGFKTANLIYPKNLVEIGSGVYQVEVDYNGLSYKGIANYGCKPTIGSDLSKTLEVHILNFDKEIYGEKIKVSFLSKIRDEKKFSSLLELKNQLELDKIRVLG